MKIDLAQLGGLFLYISIAWMIFVAIMNVVLSVSVYNNAEEMQDEGKQVYLVPSVIWGLLTLIGGVFVAVAFWLMHHSTLNPETIKEIKKENL